MKTGSKYRKIAGESRASVVFNRIDHVLNKTLLLKPRDVDVGIIKILSSSIQELIPALKEKIDSSLTQYSQSLLGNLEENNLDFGSFDQTFKLMKMEYETITDKGEALVLLKTIDSVIKRALLAAPSFHDLFKDIPSYMWKSDTELKYYCPIVTEEVAPASFYEELGEKPSLGNVGVYTGCFSALDLACRRTCIDYLILIDMSLGVEEFWENLEVMIKKSTTCEEMLEEIHKNKIFERSVGSIKESIKQEISWLSNENYFQKIKRIFEQKKFVFIRNNFLDANICQNIGFILQKANLTIDTIYISNINEFSAFTSSGVIPYKPRQHSLIANPDSNINQSYYLIESSGSSDQGINGKIEPALSLKICPY